MKIEHIPKKWQLVIVAMIFFASGFLTSVIVRRISGNHAENVSTSVPDVTMEELGETSLDYIVENFLRPQGTEGRLLGVEEYGDSLYMVNISIERGELSQQISVLVSRDGKLILLGNGGIIVDLKEEPKVEQKEEKAESEWVLGPDDDPYKGSPDAPVTIIEFSDFQCPYCAAFFGSNEALIASFKQQDPTWEAAYPRIIEEYVETGKVKFVFRDFPLSNHPYAQKAAEAAECADDQEKFWEYHDILFEKTPKIEIESLKQYASDLGLDTAQFNNCLDSGKYTSEVQKDLQDGARAGVTGTPAFFVNGKKLSGAQPFSAFKQVIEEELSKAEAE